MKKFILLFCFILHANIYSQYFLNEPAPLQPGNYWLYSDYSGEKFSYRVIDSITFIDSNFYYIVEHTYQNGPQLDRYYQYNRLDTNKFYIRYNDALFSNLEVKYFKKDAKLNETWTNTFSASTLIPYYTIVDTGTTTWNGIITKVKTLEVTDSALVDQFQTWSDDFGLIQVMDFEGGSNFLIACVINGKVFGDTTFTDVKEIRGNIPTKFSLSQNFPNPFNPSTNISYSLPQAGLVNLKIFDLLGNEVAELINEVKEKGNYRVQFNSENLSSGVYIYTVRFKNFVESKRMILMK